MKAHIVIEKSPESGHLYASSPELQGFHAHGENFELLSRNVVEVIRWLHEHQKKPLGELQLVFSPESMDWSARNVTILVTDEAAKVAAA